jgi:AraC family transcriptional regulator
MENHMEIEIIELSEMTCARFLVLSASPEEEAWGLLDAWARPNGLFDSAAGSRIFGFNNPDPSAGSPNYGYEFWITVTAEPANVSVVHFPGGRYATVPFEGATPYELPNVWKALVEQVEATEYRLGTHQWLEGISLEGMPVRLYLPIQ